MGGNAVEAAQSYSVMTIWEGKAGGFGSGSVKPILRGVDRNRTFPPIRTSSRELDGSGNGLLIRGQGDRNLTGAPIKSNG